MAKFTRVEVINAIYDLGLEPVFYHNDSKIAKKLSALVPMVGPG